MRKFDDIEEMFDGGDQELAAKVATSVAGIARQDGEKEDAAEDLGVFTATELHKVLSRIYEKEYSAQSARKVFPITSELSDTDQTFEYRVYDKVGMATIISDFTDDLETSDVVMSREYGRVFRFGTASYYSLDEMKTANAKGKPLNAMRIEAAQEAHDELINKLIFQGSKPHKILGVFENPNIPSIVSDGWLDADNKTMHPQVMIDELERAIEMIDENTKGNHRATRIVIPPRARKVLNQLMPNTAVSYFEHFTKLNPDMEIISIAETADIDGKGTSACLVYEYNPMNMSFEIPEAFNVLNPQAQGLYFMVPHTSKFSGLMVYRPTTMVMITGVIKTGAGLEALSVEKEGEQAKTK